VISSTTNAQLTFLNQCPDLPRPTVSVFFAPLLALQLLVTWSELICCSFLSYNIFQDLVARFEFRCYKHLVFSFMHISDIITPNGITNDKALLPVLTPIAYCTVLLQEIAIKKCVPYMYIYYINSKISLRSLLPYTRAHRYLRRRRRLCFWCNLFVCLSVCLSACPSDYSQTCERILTKFFVGVGHGSRTK